MKNIYKVLTACATLFAGTATFAQNLNITFQDQLAYPGQTLANICGYVDSLGNEYALCGASQGMDIVDVTNPSNVFQVTQIPNIDDLWKEIKVYRGFAYVTTEGGGGLQIVDLRPLPGTSLPYHNYTGDGAINGQLGSIHALHIDTTTGFCYLFGSNLFNGGAVVLDLNADPYNPTYAGKYDQLGYVHDGYVDNDTLYAGHIYAGYFAVVDMTNKTNPVVLATQTTPTAFTHNLWRTDDDDFVLSTDENSNSFLACYDVSDPANIQEMDRIQSQFPNSGSVVHNTHILNNWAITSWYKDGFVITDVTRPHNLVNVGWYDTYGGSGSGFQGAWGVYPFLPSGTIVVSNINEGLFVFSPNYVRACYLEGTVMDSVCNLPLSGVTVNICATDTITEVSNLSGEIFTGTAVPGTYNVTFTKPGYVTYTMNNVVFAAGQVVTFNINMYSATAVALTGNTSDAITTNDVAGAQILLTNPNNTYNFISDVSGNFSSCSVIADDYSIVAAAWGYTTVCTTDSIYSGNATQNFQLSPGYQDEFTFDLGWTVSSTASSGTWERGEPVGTTYNTSGDANPEFDVNNDCTDMCYVTGNAGGTASQDDVDNGGTTLTSPAFDVSTYAHPWIHYDRWFFNDGGSGNPNDSLVIRLTDGTTTVTLEKVIASTPGNSSWQHRAYRISDYMTPGANMQLIVTTADNGPGHLVEAGFDAFLVADSIDLAVNAPVMESAISVYPNPFDGTTNVRYALGNAPADGAFIEVQDLSGRVVMTQVITSQQGTIEIGSNLSGGVYFVRVVNGTEASKAVRLIKTK